ncbi:MAG TPA: MMPL family transporter, partial [Thermoanaerobaculia bacterium]|nr:MMPL family transporter [Thermoanaerobaculia bacterium]
MIGSLLERLNQLVQRRPRAILAVALAIVAAAGLLATRLRLDPDVLNLIPRNNREVNEFRDLLRETGTLDFHVVVLQFPKGSDPATYGPLIDNIGEQLRASKLIDNASWRIPDPFSLVEKVLPYSMLVLSPTQLDAVAAKLSDEGIRASVARNAAVLQTPQSGIAKQIVRVDPFNLLPIFMEKLQRAGGNLKLDFSTGYYVSTDHSAAVIISRPHTAAQQLPFSRAVMDETRRIVAAATNEFRKTNPGAALPSIGFTGGYAIAAADEKIIRRDMTMNSITSMLGVLLLYLYAYRRPSALLYAAVPMTMAIVITFGVGALTYRTLSAASTGFAALLAGLGVDFLTVLYERYVDERNRGADVAGAVGTLMHHAMPGIIVGALTTAATFYAFLATDFRGMTELGFLTGTGIVIFLLCVMFVFPALLVVMEGRRTSARKLYVHAFGSGRVVRASLKRPRAVIVAWIVIVAITGVAATGVEFSDSLQNLRSKDNEGVQLQELVASKFGQSFESMMYGVRGATAAEAIAKTERAIPDLDRIARNRTIGGYESIATFLPSEAQQQQVIARLARGANGEFSFARIESTLHAALIENGFRPTAYDSFLPAFGEALAQRVVARDRAQRLGDEIDAGQHARGMLFPELLQVVGKEARPDPLGGIDVDDGEEAVRRFLDEALHAFAEAEALQFVDSERLALRERLAECGEESVVRGGAEA